jgi:hypothetical protein
VKTAAQMAANYQAGMSNPQTATKYTQGVQGVTTSPTAAAATDAAMQAYVTGVQTSVQNGKRAASLNAVTLQQWQQACTTKGAQRLQSGAAAAQAKVQAFFTKFAPVYQQASDAAKAAVGPIAKVQAAINVMRTAAGKPPV